MRDSRRFSSYFIPTLKEDPREAEIPSHKLMIRAGMIRRLASGVYEFLPLGWKVVRKIEAIIREELNAIGAQEIIMSALQPKELWEESGRWELYGPELMRLKDRGGREFCLGPTHEEVVTRIVAENIKSYRQLPFSLYQFQMKFRDEIRPRFGIMRAREFYMKDSYSFDLTEEGCRNSYDKHYEAYKKIFTRCGLDYAIVEADTGNIGGEYSHEFMVLSSIGEEAVVVCSCGYGANTEMASYSIVEKSSDLEESSEEKEPVEVNTPGLSSIEEITGFMKMPAERFIKTLIYKTEKGLIAALIRGDAELNERLLKAAVGVEDLTMASPEEIQEATGAPLGFSGPLGIKVPIYADTEILSMKNAVSGANIKDYHLKNINPGRDFTPEWSGNLRLVRAGDLCPECSSELKILRGIEVGHTFLLGNRYSAPMQANYTDEKGDEKEIVMGCYGIGVSRLAAAAIEQHHDEYGIIWPTAIAPFEAVIIQIADDAESAAAGLYADLKEEYDILWDDRKESPGVKFKDAQLIGIPVQMILGKQFLKDGRVEVVFRSTGEKQYLLPEEIAGILKKHLRGK
ncbi:MAG: proline--tRNA ligase [Elusimicrobia bacterium]|nr:proline--tRNA ligase [Elusimicrobiota bacterium]